MRVAVDIDGVVADHLGGAAEVYHERTGRRLPRSLPTWDVRLPGLDRSVHSFVDDLLADPSFLATLDPFPNAPSAVRRLRRADHRIVVATHRPTHTHATTKAWLDDHEIPYDRFVHDVPDDKTALPVDALLDDYHGTVARADAPAPDDELPSGLDDWTGTAAFLLLRPWNRQYAAAVPRSRLVHSWHSFCRVIC